MLRRKGGTTTLLYMDVIVCIFAQTVSVTVKADIRNGVFPLESNGPLEPLQVRFFRSILIEEHLKFYL
jgi:hypothetical protein